MNRLTEGNSTSQEVQPFILIDIFLENNYCVIRVYIDGLFSRTNPTVEVLKLLANNISSKNNLCTIFRNETLTAPTVHCV